MLPVRVRVGTWCAVLGGGISVDGAEGRRVFGGEQWQLRRPYTSG